MSNYLQQTGKDNLNQPVFISEEAQKFQNGKVSDNLGAKQTLTTAQPVGTAHLGSGMPEAYMSAGGYYTNNTGFAAMSFPNFSQPAQWSTGANNPPAAPQSYDHTAMQYSGLGAAPTPPTNGDATQNHQYVTADHLFNQNSSTYQSTYSAAPFMNGSWSYFNSPSSYFFPTGNGDLNLNWGTTPAPTDNPNNALFQDLYKPPPPPEIEKPLKVIDTNPPSELSSGFENGESKQSPIIESVEQSLSGMSVSDKETEKVLENSVPVQNVSSNANTAPTKPIPSAPPSSGHSNAPAKPVSWAAVASQPAKSKPPPKKTPQKPPMSTTSMKPNYSNQNGTVSNSKGKQQTPSGGRWNRQNQNSGNQNNNSGTDNTVAVPNDSHLDINRLKDNSPLLKKLMNKFNFNPRELNIDTKNARFLIIKSYSEDDIFRSIKYSSWTSTEHGNRRLNDAFTDQEKTGVKTPIYLLFSVNSSGHFCGVAEMKSTVDFDVETGIFVQDKWKGRFDVRWIYVKDVPNSTLRHIRLENNENKPVTNSRDTQEVHPDKAKQVLKIIHNYKAQTSIFDDFSHYEKRQEDDAKLRSKKMPEPNL